MSYERENTSGFTLIEIMVVCAIIAALAMVAYPNMVRFSAQQRTKAAAVQMAGLLNEARSRATAEATPYLVYFNPRTVDVNGLCGPAATLVRDSDRSYSISADDKVRDIALPEGACEQLKQQTETVSEPLAELVLPVEDLSVRALEVAAPPTNPSLPLTGSVTKLVDVLVNDATFPIDQVSGRSVVAFSERGIPVDPESPTNWGSGAGAIYITDGRSTVYAALVQPLGNVQLRVFDRVSGDWR